MNEYKEQLSAYLDGELDDGEIHRLQPDVEAAEFSTSCRYQMIAAAMRGELDESDMLDVSQRVRVAILQEKSYTKHVSPESSAKTGWFGAAWWRPVGGMAIAASVALVMVMAATDVQSPGTDTVVATQSGAQQNDLRVTPVAQPMLAARPFADNVRPVANLNTYLSEHSEFAAQDTMQGRLPFVRAVSYESR